MLRIGGQTAEIFCGHSWVAGGCHRLKIIKKKFFQNIFSIFLRKILGPSAST